MIQYIDVHSHIFPETKRSKTKVRVPSNIREQEVIDDNGKPNIEYIYDEDVYEIDEFFMIENENLNMALNVSMFALDESYEEQSNNTDTILLAMDEAFMQIVMLQEQVQEMNAVIANLQEELKSMKGDAE